MSEVSDIEQTLWDIYGKSGDVVVWGIASDDTYADVNKFVKQFGLTFPVLFDPGGKVLADYGQEFAFSNTVYPQDWLIGVDGDVVYYSNAYDAPTLISLIEAELEKAAAAPSHGSPDSDR